MRSALLLVLLAASSARAQPHPHAGPAEETRTLDVPIGEQRTIEGHDAASYSDSENGVAEIRLTTEGDFVVVGQHVGMASLLLMYADGHHVAYRIRVFNGDERPPDVVEPRDNIRLDLYFVQLSESYGHQIGVGFPGSIGGPNVGTGNFVFDLAGGMFQQASLQLVNQVLPRLDLAQSSGWARIRRQAMVVTANGTSAEFSSGGEVNIRVVGGLSNTVRTIEFGSALRVTPRFDPRSGRIEIQVHADISELSEPFAPEDPPGRRRTQLDSLVNMRPGQAIVLAGLAGRSEQESQGGLPGLSQIPILGVLFGTNTRRGDASENLLFIVPTVVQPVSSTDHDYITEALETFEHFGGGIRAVDMIDHRPEGY